MENKLAADLEFITATAADSFVHLSGKKVFLFGGTGFFGKWLLQAFNWFNQHTSQLPVEVWILSRDPEAFRRSNPELARTVSLVQGDNRDFDFPPGRFDLVIHGATDTNLHRSRNNQTEVTKQIVDGTRRILEFCHSCSAERLLYISSGAVYGKTPSSLEKVPEEYLPSDESGDHSNGYGEGKRVSERLVLHSGTHAGLEVVVARGFTFAGPYLPLGSHFAFGNFIASAMKERHIVIEGDGTAIRSYMYMADMVIWLLRILTRADSSRIYNVGSSQAVSIASLARKIAASIQGCQVAIVQRENPDLLIDRYVPDVQLALDELDLQIWTGLDDIIAKTINWYTLS
jgi:dTDP-glucose 4,6-dehydratase